VLQPRGDIRAARRARDRHRRNTVGRDLVAQVVLWARRGVVTRTFAVARLAVGERASVDDLHAAQVRLRNALGAYGQDGVLQHDHRQLKLLRQVEGVDGGPEAIHHARRRQDDALDLAVRAVDRDVQIALFVAGRHARGGAGTLAIDDHRRDLGHAGEAEHLGHQADAWTGGGGHGFLARV